MKLQAVTGVLLLTAGGLCPLIRVPIMGTWNYFGIDPFLGGVYYCFVLLAVWAIWKNKPGMIRFAGWAALVWVMLSLAAVWFKSHDLFGFIHFRKLINLAAGMVKYKWGWLVIIAGSGVLITMRRPVKPIAGLSLSTDAVN